MLWKETKTNFLSFYGLVTFSNPTNTEQAQLYLVVQGAQVNLPAYNDSLYNYNHLFLCSLSN